MKVVWLSMAFLILVSSSYALEGFSSPQADVSLGDSLIVSDSVVYSSGYISDDGQNWEQFSFTGRTRGNWIIGEAISSVRTNANYYAMYSCTWSSGWSCSSGWEVYDQSTQPPSDYVPKDSLQGDFEALQALYESTQGQFLEVLDSKEELPTYQDSPYPPIYLIEEEIHYPKFDSKDKFVEWRNAGPVWEDKTGWTDMTPETMGDAVGVDVDEDGRVVRLDMQKINMQGDNTLGNGLAGILPREIGNLQRLEYLNIKQNFFHGTIPKELGSLENLYQLSLAGQRCEPHAIRGWFEGNHRHCKDGSGKAYEETNAFTGDLPKEFGNLENLWLLEIRGQYLTGTLPPEWGDMKNLERLFVNGVRGPASQRLHGTIPVEWVGMEKMQYFHLGNYREEGQLTGEIPEEINQGWTNLWNILISGNKFSGSVPEFPNSRSKRFAHFADNQFTGTFPSQYFNGDNGGMTALILRDNMISGPLPQEVPSPNNKDKYTMGTIRLQNNNFSGPMPQWLMELPVIQFNLNGVGPQGFTGPFPQAAAENPKLRLFWIANNDMSGPLPDVNWSSPALYSILINGNEFEGAIPASWESMVTNYLDESGDYDGRIWRIYLSGNNLEGPVPDWFADITTLNRLHLQGNSYVFRDLLPVYDDVLSTMEIAVLTGRNDNPDFRVSPQQPFGDSESQNVGVGDSLVVDFSDDVGYQGNVYVWSRDGEVVSGQDSSVLRINSVSAFDAGEYVLEVSNSGLPELVLESVPVSVSVS